MRSWVKCNFLFCFNKIVIYYVLFIKSQKEQNLKGKHYWIEPKINACPKDTFNMYKKTEIKDMQIFFLSRSSLVMNCFFVYLEENWLEFWWTVYLQATILKWGDSSNFKTGFLCLFWIKFILLQIKFNLKEMWLERLLKSDRKKGLHVIKG